MTSDTLANIPLFKDLAPAQRAELSAALEEKPVSASHPIFWVGDVGASFYIIKQGRITLSCPDDSGQEITLAELGPGQFFGELSLLDGGRRTATARATTDAILFSLDRGPFQQFLLKHPAATIQIISELGRRQREVLDKLRGVVNVNQAYEEHMTHWSRIANTIATASASQTFVLVHVAAVLLWVGYNLLRGQNGLDPFPFPFMAMVASLEAIFLSMFVLISQNRQNEKDRIRADLDLSLIHI